MPNIKPMDREELAEFEPFFSIMEGAVGWVPQAVVFIHRVGRGAARRHDGASTVAYDGVIRAEDSRIGKQMLYH